MVSLDELTRKELQKKLMKYNLPATGTTEDLRERYAAFRLHGVVPIETKLKKPPQEKRLARTRSSCSIAIRGRIERVLTQRMYLIDCKMMSSGSKDCPGAQFSILGSTGSVYTVYISKAPHCDCPDHGRTHLCKHILFILLKVFQLSTDSKLIFQAAWLSGEVEYMMKRLKASPAYRGGGSSVVANGQVRKTYEQLESGVSSKPKNSSSNIKRSGWKKPNLSCPVCFDFLGGKEDVVCCPEACAMRFHKVCMLKWARIKGQQGSCSTCPTCRSPWNGGKQKERVGDQGYTNLGILPGLPRERDTSTYNYRGYY